MQLPNVDEIPVLAFIFVMGLTFGSFVTLLSYRLIKNQDVIFTPSQCPKCEHRLGFFDLFPVFSWIFNLGKCSHCGVSVSIRYPIIELFVGLMFVTTFYFLGFTLNALIITMLGVCLITITVTDLEYTLIPNQMQVVMILLGVVYRVVPETRDYEQLIFGPIIGLAAGYIIRYVFTKWKGQEALGMGDVKFLATVGIFLEFELIITFLFLSGVVGILTAQIWSSVGKGKQFPFGPALAVSLYVCLVIPGIQDFVREYLVNLLEEHVG